MAFGDIDAGMTEAEKQHLTELEALNAKQSGRISGADTEIGRLRADLKLANECIEWPRETWCDTLIDQYEIMEDQLGMYQAGRSQDIIRIREQSERITELESGKELDELADWWKDLHATACRRAEAAEAENVKLREACKAMVAVFKRHEEDKRMEEWDIAARDAYQLGQAILAKGGGDNAHLHG